MKLTCHQSLSNKMNLHKNKNKKIKCHQVIKANNKTAAAETHYTAKHRAAAFFIFIYLYIYITIYDTNVKVLK